MTLTVVGSMAFDAIETPFGKTDKIVGGAATYISLSASHFTKNVNIVSVVGEDFPKETINDLQIRGINTEGLQVKKGEKTFFWKGKYHTDLNQRDTLVTDLNVLGNFDPILPDSYQNTEYLMLGNLSPTVQKNVINRLKERPKMIAMDTMNFWMDVDLKNLEETIRMVDILIINDEEARLLTNEYSIAKSAKMIMKKYNLRYLVIKKGEHGALLFGENGTFYVPALPLEEVFDPTGAGDTFAGGFMGYIAKTADSSFENMKKALVYGSVMASFCVERFGTQMLQKLDEQKIQKRIQIFKDLVNW